MTEKNFDCDDWLPVYVGLKGQIEHIAAHTGLSFQDAAAMVAMGQIGAMQRDLRNYHECLHEWAQKMRAAQQEAISEWKRASGEGDGWKPGEET